MDEFSLINAIKQKTYNQASLIKGIGDDAAVLRETASDLVVAVDTFVENIHFAKETMEAYHVGYRALAANFSDLAAMGAWPAYYLVSITVSKEWDETEINELFAGMKSLAHKYRADLIGGDTVSGDKLVLSITVMGRVEQGKARYRHIAEPGDVVFVTGTLGDSQAGLHLLQHNMNHQDREYFVNRHRMPTPRIEFAQAIKKLNRVSLNDVSDGLANEVHEIAEASGVSIVMQDDCIPVHPAYLSFPEQDRFRWKYFGGEDFELLGTVPKEDWRAVQREAEQLNLKVTEIGAVINQAEFPAYLKKDGQIAKLEKAGFMHLK